VIKKEVLDLSDLADKLGRIIIAQHDRFNLQKVHLEGISNVLPQFLLEHKLENSHPPDESEEFWGPAIKYEQA